MMRQRRPVREMATKRKTRGGYMISVVAEMYEIHPRPCAFIRQTLRMYEREGLRCGPAAQGWKHTALYRRKIWSGFDHSRVHPEPGMRDLGQPRRREYRGDRGSPFCRCATDCAWILRRDEPADAGRIRRLCARRDAERRSTSIQAQQNPGAGLLVPNHLRFKRVTLVTGVVMCWSDFRPGTEYSKKKEAVVRR